MPSHTRPGPLSLPLAGGARLVATAERGPDPSGRWYWRVRHHGEGARPTVTEQVLGTSARAWKRSALGSSRHGKGVEELEEQPEPL